MVKKTKALFLTFYFNPDLCAGSFRASALAHELCKQPNLELHVITTMPNRYNEYKAQAENEQRSDNLKVTRIDIPSHRSGIIDQILSFWCFYSKAISLSKKENYDLILATSSRLFTAYLGAKIARSKKSILYLDIRDLARDTLVDLYRPPMNYLLDLFLKRVENYTFNSASHINVVSEGFKNYVNKNYPSVKSSVFSNGIDPEFMDFQHSDDLNFEKRLKTNLIQITYAGNIGAGQALEIIIPELAHKLKSEAFFRIIGSGSRLKALKERVQNLRLDNVIIVEPMDRKELKIEYQMCDILFMHLNDIPAFEKVLPSKIFEYAATGKPILAGVNGYAKSFLEENVTNCEIFYPGNIWEAIEAFKRTDISYENRSKFKNKFSRKLITESMVKDIMRVYQGEK